MNQIKSFINLLFEKKIVRFCLVAILVMGAIFATNTAVQTISNNYNMVVDETPDNTVNKASSETKSPSMTKNGKKYLPIYSVATDKKKVAISFDAAWGADDTDKILSILDEYDAPATFFLCGYWVEKYPEEVKKIYEAGHEIGNHGSTHAHSNLLSKEENKKEIMGCHEKVKELLGIDMTLFRPPFGEYNDTVIQAADELGYYTVQWNVETIDIVLL